MKSRKIKLDVLESSSYHQDHFIVIFGRPGRIEITLTTSGEIVAFVYDGMKIDEESCPIGCYDSLLDKNLSWESL